MQKVLEKIIRALSARLTLARLLFDAQPFASEPLDKLAETMGVSASLKKDKNARYYLAKGNASGCTALFNGTIVFDKKWYQMLTAEEVLAVGAHEFNHLINKNSRQKFFRIIVPSFVILVIAGVLTSVITISLQNKGYFVLTGFAAVLLPLFAFFGSWFLSAPWQRQQETCCDLSAVRFGYGEAMITALTKLRERFPKSKWDTKLSKLFPRTHPPLQQRIQNIRQAMAEHTNSK